MWQTPQRGLDIGRRMLCAEVLREPFFLQMTMRALPDRMVLKLPLLQRDGANWRSRQNRAPPFPQSILRERFSGSSRP